MGRKSKKDDMSSPMMNDDYMHEDHARTLTKAGEILSDPGKMKGAMRHIKKQKKAFKSIDQLKKFHQQKFGKHGDPTMHGVEDLDEDGE